MITIATDSGLEEIEAFVYGHLAIHLNPRPENVHGRGHLWCLTHVPSGRSVKTLLRSRKEAAALTKTLAPMCDWSAENPSAAVPAARWAEVVETVRLMRVSA